MDKTKKRKSVNKKLSKFKKELYAVIHELIEKVDESTLKNKDISGGIGKIVRKAGVSWGQAQKVVNVYLKFYCVLSNKRKIFKELDCPLDSEVMHFFQFPLLKSLKEIEKSDYTTWQKYLKRMFNGYALLADNIYNINTLYRFLNKKKKQNSLKKETRPIHQKLKFWTMQL